MALPATDSFTGTDWQQLTDYSANWSYVNGSMLIYSNSVMYDSGASGNAIARWNADTFADDQYSQVRIVSMGAAQYVGVAVRCSAASFSCYGVIVNAGYLEFYKWVNASYSSLGFTSSVTFAPNDILRMEANGTTVRVLQNGTERISITDSALTSGQPGLSALNYNQDSRMDDWQGGNLAVAAVTSVMLIGTRARLGGLQGVSIQAIDRQMALRPVVATYHLLLHSGGALKLHDGTYLRYHG